MNNIVYKNLNNITRCNILRNKRKLNIHDKLLFNIVLAEREENKKNKTLLFNQALGAVDIAVDFGLITHDEWEKYIERIFAGI